MSYLYLGYLGTHTKISQHLVSGHSHFQRIKKNLTSQTTEDSLNKMTLKCISRCCLYNKEKLTNVLVMGDLGIYIPLCIILMWNL